MNPSESEGEPTITVTVSKAWARVALWLIAAWFGVEVLDFFLTIILHAFGWWPEW